MSYFNVKNKIEEIKNALNNSVDFSHRIYKRGNQVLGFIF